MRFTEIHRIYFFMQHFNYISQPSSGSCNLHPMPNEDCKIALQMSLNEPHYWLDFCDYVERGNASSGEIGELNGMLVNLIRVAAGWTQNLTWRRT